MLTIKYSDMPPGVLAGHGKGGASVCFGDTVRYYDTPSFVVYRHGDIMLHPIGINAVFATSEIRQGDFSGVDVVGYHVDGDEVVMMGEEGDEFIQKVIEHEESRS